MEFLKDMTKAFHFDTKSWLSIFVIFFAVVITLLKVATPYMTIATVAYLIMLAGVLRHSQKEIHIPLMSFAVVIDLSLVLFLEFDRSAIASAIGGKLNFWQKGHILFSTLAVALYIPTMILGTKALTQKGRRLQNHKYLGKIAFVFRTLGFILMFSLLSHVKSQ